MLQPKSHDSLIRCRLCRRVAMAVFAAILVVEVLIFIPSLWKFENERLAERREQAAAAVIAFLRSMPDEAIARGPDAEIERLLGVAGIASVRLLDAVGRTIAVVGDAPPPEVPRSATGWRQLDAGRLLIWEPVDRGVIHTSYFCIKTPNLLAELWAFGFRILAMVMLIALVVTGVTMFVLRRLVLQRIVVLEDGLTAAGREPGGAAGLRVRDDGDDELSSVARSFNAMTEHVAHAMSELRDREARLARLADVLEAKVTERTAHLAEALDQAQAAARAKDAFLGNMSHELRTPLNAMIGFAEMMSGEMLGPLGHPRYRGYSTDIMSSGRRLLAVIDDILDMSALDDASVKSDLVRVDLGDVVHGVVADLAEQARTADVIVTVAELQAAMIVSGDPRRLARLCRCLISNAITFNHPGGVVTIRMQALANGSAELEIKDTGVGIGAGDVARVMRPFEQVAGVLARRHQGAGLGLPLAIRLARWHGGELSLTSEVGCGTCARVILPYGDTVMQAVA